MNETRGMGGRKTFGYLRAEMHDVPRRDRPIVQSRAHRRALDELSDQELDTGVLPDVEHADDVGMVERRCRARFPLESLAGDAIPSKIPGENLDGHDAAEACIARPVHLPHPARPKRIGQLVGP